MTTGAKEIIEHGKNGFFVSIGDAQALANKILYLLNNPDKAKEIGENGRKLVKEKYGDNTSKIINFWQEIVNDKIEINYKNNKLIINYSIRQGTGDTILYLHGLGCSKEDFDPIVNSNRFKNYNLVSFDFPGCGSTPYPESLDLTIDDLVEITDAFVYNLKLNNFVLIGHSMGGLVGLLYSEKFSSKVKSFINVDKPQLYNIVNGNYGRYELKLKITSSEFTFNAFTFG